MSRSLFPSDEVYLLDTSSLLRLDGLDDLAPIDPFTDAERDAIWDGLKKFAEQGRLKIIKQVKAELKRHHKRGLYRLINSPRHEMIIPRNEATSRIYRDVTSKHPDLIPVVSTRNPADPWLIVAAEISEYRIICEEKSKEERSQHQPRRKLDQERIPDVCKARHLPAPIKLRDLAKQEGWIK
jgi:hypothetical protein